MVDPGGPAPWHHLGDHERRITLDRVRQTFAEAPPALRSEREHLVTRGAAVLVPLYAADGDTHVVLTRRSPDLRVHSGEVSFPGGGQDPGEDLDATARREAHEEVDLDPALVEVVGQLDHLSTITSNSFIVPYVGIVAGGRPRLAPNPAEVDAVLHVPLRELMLPEVYREERWHIFGTVRPVFFFELEGDTVWGATAAMLRQLLGLLTGTLTRGELDHF
jgi:8-oxo-dGTP pyrophosphatase MutT (NUDIX family)